MHVCIYIMCVWLYACVYMHESKYLSMYNSTHVCILAPAYILSKMPTGH